MGVNHPNMQILPLGVDPQTMYYSEQEKSAVKKRLGISNKFVLIYAGKLNHSKRIDLILKILTELVWPTINWEKMESGHGILLKSGKNSTNLTKGEH